MLRTVDQFAVSLTGIKKGLPTNGDIESDIRIWFNAARIELFISYCRNSNDFPLHLKQEFNNHIRDILPVGLKRSMG